MRRLLSSHRAGSGEFRLPGLALLEYLMAEVY